MAPCPHGRRTLLVLLLVALVVPQSSCATLNGMLAGQPKPEITVQDVALAEANLQRIALRVDFQVKNPYSVSLPVVELQYRVHIAGVQLAEGKVEVNQGIPAQGSAPLTSTLAFGPIDAARVASRLAMGSRQYRIEGTVTVKTPIGPLGVTMSHQGKLTGSNLPKMGLPRLFGG